MNIELAKQIAAMRKGQCLSSKYENAHTKLLWLCEKGHKWNAPLNAVKNLGTWCPTCAQSNAGISKRRKIEDMQAVANERGGRCLSAIYKGNHEKLHWQCKYGHEWWATATNILSRKSWCPFCAGKAPLTLEILKEHAQKLNGECLEQKYLGNAKQKHRFQCEMGHQFLMRASSIRKGQWCPKCRWGGLPNIAEARALAFRKGGRCLSEDYKNAKTHLLWECSSRHQWATTFNQVKRGSWCPKCANQQQADRQRGTLEEMQGIAKARGGRCLSDKYVDSFTKLDFECSNGHLFQLKPNRLKQGGWCKFCYSFIGESICRYYLEKIFEAPFPKSRPAWLKLPHGGYELDGYSEALKIAFEHHGLYHYKVDRLRSKTEKDVQIRQKKDEIKEDLCKQNGVKLIVIPELFNITPLHQLGELVKEICLKQSIDIPNYRSPLDIDFQHLYTCSYGKDMLEKLNQAAQERGGECLSDSWCGSSVKLHFKCKENHLFSTLPFSVLGGHWCLKCSKRYPINIEGVQKLVSSFGGKCLSSDYRNVQSRLHLQCKNGYLFEDTYAAIKSRKIFCRCSKCLEESPLPEGFHNRKRLGIGKMQILAGNYGGQCISTSYKNGSTLLSWKCKYEHVFQSSYNQIIARKWFCPCHQCYVQHSGEKHSNKELK